jgi:hypothetical protein
VRRTGSSSPSAEENRIVFFEGTGGVYTPTGFLLKKENRFTNTNNRKLGAESLTELGDKEGAEEK